MESIRNADNTDQGCPDDAWSSTAPILQIDHHTVTVAELLSRLSQYQLLPKLRQEMVIDAAIAPFHCTPEEQNQCCQDFYAQHQLTSDAARQAWLQQQGMTEIQLIYLATRQHRIEQFKQATWGHQSESYFLQWKSQLDRVIYSLIRVKDSGIAKELYFRLKANEQPFAELAQQYSQGLEAQAGGVIGPVPMNKPHAKLAQLLRACQPGQISPPTRIEDVWVIVRLEQFLPAQLDQSMRQRLLDELFTLWLKDQLKQPPVICMATHPLSPYPDNTTFVPLLTHL